MVHLAGLALTRVTIVDHSGKTLLDELVLPAMPIIDYNTQYSGISAATLEGVTTTLEEVRDRVMCIIGADTIVVSRSEIISRTAS